MKTKTYYLVTYYSPGTFFSESSSYKFTEFNLWKFCQKAKEISERYDAKPYGFNFQKLEIPVDLPKTEGFKVTVEPKILEKSGTFYITGDVIFSENLIGKDEQILKSNLESNNNGVGIVNNNSFKFRGAFEKDDNIVNWDGLIIRRGNDKDLVAYRKKIREKKRKEYQKYA